MKKFLAMLLVGAVLFTSLAATVGCGGDTGTKKVDDKKKEEK